MADKDKKQPAPEDGLFSWTTRFVDELQKTVQDSPSKGVAGSQPAANSKNTEEIESLQTQVKQQQAMLKQIEDRYKEELAKAQAAIEEAAKKEKELRTFTREKLLEKKKEVDELNAQLSHKNAEIEALKNEKKALEMQAKERDAESPAAKVQEDHIELISHAPHGQDDTQTMAVKSELSEPVAANTLDMEELALKLREKDSKIEKLDEYVARLEFKISQLEDKLIENGERAELRQKVLMYEKELKNCKEQLILSDSERARLSEELVSIRTSSTSASSETQSKVDEQIQAALDKERSIWQQKLAQDTAIIDQGLKSKYEKDMAALQGEIAGLLAEKQRLEGENSKLIEKAGSTQTKLQEERGKLKQVQTELETVKYALSMAEKSISENENAHEKELIKLRKELETVQKKSGVSQASDKALQTELSTLKVSVKQLEYARDAADRNIAELETANTTLTKKLETMSVNLVACQDSLTASDARIVALTDEYERNLIALKDRTRQLESAEKSLSAEREALQVCKSELAGVQRDFERFKEKAKLAVAQRDSALEALHVEMESLKSEARNAGMERSKLFESLQEMRSASARFPDNSSQVGVDDDLIEIQRRIETAEGANVKMRKVCQELMEEKDALTKKIEEQMNRCVQAETSLLKQQRRLREMELECKTLNEKVQALIQEKDLLAEEKEARIQNANAKLLALQKELRRVSVDSNAKNWKHLDLGSIPNSDSQNDFQSPESSPMAADRRSVHTRTPSTLATASTSSYVPPTGTETISSSSAMPTASPSNVSGEVETALRKRAEFLEREVRNLKAELNRYKKKVNEMTEVTDALGSLAAY